MHNVRGGLNREGSFMGAREIFWEEVFNNRGGGVGYFHSILFAVLLHFSWIINFSIITFLHYSSIVHEASEKFKYKFTPSSIFGRRRRYRLTGNPNTRGDHAGGDKNKKSKKLIEAPNIYYFLQQLLSSTRLLSKCVIKQLTRLPHAIGPPTTRRNFKRYTNTKSRGTQVPNQNGTLRPS